MQMLYKVSEERSAEARKFRVYRAANWVFQVEDLKSVRFVWTMQRFRNRLSTVHWTQRFPYHFEIFQSAGKWPMPLMVAVGREDAVQIPFGWWGICPIIFCPLHGGWSW